MKTNVTVKFKSAPSDLTHACNLSIDWSNVPTVITNICVIINSDDTGDAVVCFISLCKEEDSVVLPKIKMNLTTASFTVQVYGLERTIRRIPYFYNVCASGKGTFEIKRGERKSWIMKLTAGRLDPVLLREMNHQPEFGLEHKRVKQVIRVTSDSVELPADILLVLREEAESNELLWLTTSASTSFFKIPIDVLNPGTTTVKAYTLQKLHCSTGVMIYEKKEVSMETQIQRQTSVTAPVKLPDMTLSQLQSLMDKSVEFMQTDTKSPIDYLYRNKSAFYFHNIINIHDGMMEMYRKDYNGDPAQSINGVLDGLFFSTGLDRVTKEPPLFSYFGVKRLHIPPSSIINSSSNMYFSDFYCHYEQHYVTVVVTKSGSLADEFCKANLLKLDPKQNPFMTTQDFESFSITLGVSVEIFYTEDIDLVSLMRNYPKSYFSRVRVRGRGQSKKYGIAKNSKCKICCI